MKNILVATIGTRDLIFQSSSGSWYNVGDDRMLDGDIIGEQAEVISDLGLASLSYRNLTQYLLENVEVHESRIKPVIIGQLLLDSFDSLEKVYLIGTDQKVGVREREKDTIYACELIKRWILAQCPTVQVEVVPLAQDGINPSDFEQMFVWWRRTWRERILVKEGQPLWVCLKGGVGQAAEASRISGLSLYGDRIQFFEFKQTQKENRAGQPSPYTGPFLGTNYLWDRTQKQAIQLLERYDYSGALEILEKGYFQKSPNAWGAIPPLLKAGVAWNQGEFESFFRQVKSYLTPAQQRQGQSWWWMAYEQAQLATIRLKQQNTTEAFLHSYRSVEGLLYAWAIEMFPQEVIDRENQYPLLCKSICQKHTQLQQLVFDQLDQKSEVNLMSWVLRHLVEAEIPKCKNSPDLKEFWGSAKEMRNIFSHRLGGVVEKEMLQAWGQEVKKPEQWQSRMLNCLNLISGQSFKSLSEASLFSKIHQTILSKIAGFELKV